MIAAPIAIPETCRRCDAAARLRCTRGLFRLYEYWNGKRGDRAFPGRGDIDPLELGGHLLPHVFLIDVLPGAESGAPQFRFRLTGTRVDEIHGQPLTGRSTRDIRTPEIAQAAERQCRQVVQRREPGCDHVMLLARDGSFWHFERLMLPLSDDGRTISMLLCGIYDT